MEQHQTQPWTGYVPETDDDDSTSIPRVPVNGWIKCTYWNGKVKVFKVRSVRVFEGVMAEQLYPPRPKGYPAYDDMFPRGRLEVIPESEALAWLEQHGMPVPGEAASAGDEERERR